uniref:Uncharacterized protein n=1 Tax=Hemiselmis tepida TaxID=464990 RepID=A0A7S0VTE0_9CRYP|mmetsp:Transcript_22484/g.56740  ORF Transcript_22484/g.56740 Transcript_22484/m.56740 type:complete len:338 (+) Transcript_22484:75-1088(+)|eukprot:CAMPEP_0174928448 /NCGR_PEP_ID=MMETSP1355-20121228/23525_1 /TAXON_ID=464990 /ORGANISM="Hemiselmis tepida, Strain CCMP443" /LENGTH=337 /DNA_ID=CAMNT_0016174609 /DNA_START=63 /DNA_END=1076 /DNA_ORIENTATION=+
MSQGATLLLTRGFRRGPLRPGGGLAKRYSHQGLGRNESPDADLCTLIVTGFEWTGEILAQESLQNIKVDEPLPADLVNSWQAKCSWFQLVGGSATRTALEQRLAVHEEKLASLLREAPTELVKSNIRKVETSIKRVKEGIDFCKVGYVVRPATFLIDARPMDMAVSLRSNGCSGPEHDVEVMASRVGSGPVVHLRVTCTDRKGKVLDTFQAVVPCRYKGHEEPDPALRSWGYGDAEYDSMTVQDMAETLQRIYFSRHPGMVETNPPRVRHYGAELGGGLRGEDVFVHHRGGATYQDLLTVVLDISPYVQPLTPEELAAKEALAMVVEGVAACIAAAR